MRCKQTIVIILTQGYAVLIDRADWPLVKKYKWRVNIGAGKKKKCGGMPYARGLVNGKQTYLHRLIMQTPDGMFVDHKNRQTLDCRRSNMENVTLLENNHRRRNAKRNKK